MSEYISKQKLIEAIEAERPLNWNDTEAELAEQGAFDYIMELIKGFCDDETDRINELAEADKEGRLKIYPKGLKCPSCEKYTVYSSVDHQFFLCYSCGFRYSKEEREKALEGLE